VQDISTESRHLEGPSKLLIDSKKVGGLSGAREKHKRLPPKSWKHTWNDVRVIESCTRLLPSTVENILPDWWARNNVINGCLLHLLNLYIYAKITCPEKTAFLQFYENFCCFHVIRAFMKMLTKLDIIIPRNTDTKHKYRNRRNHSKDVFSPSSKARSWIAKVVFPGFIPASTKTLKTG